MAFPGDDRFDTRNEGEIAVFSNQRQQPAPRSYGDEIQDVGVDNLESRMRGMILKNQDRSIESHWRVGDAPPAWDSNNIPMGGPGPQGLPDFFGPQAPQPGLPENHWPPPKPFQPLQNFHGPPPPGSFAPPPHVPKHPHHTFFHGPMDNIHSRPPPAPRFVGDLADMNDFPPLGATPSPPPPPPPPPPHPPPPQQQHSSANSPQNDIPPPPPLPPTGPKRFGGSPRMHYATHKSYGSVSHFSGNPAIPLGPQQHQRARSFNHPPRDGQEIGYHTNQGGGGRHNSHGHRNRFQSGVKPPHRSFDIDYDKITAVALDQIAEVDVTEAEVKRKEKVLALLTKVCETILPGSKLITFGSYVSGLATTGADLDLIMEHNTIEPKLSSPDSDVPVKLAEAFLKRGFKVALLTKTRVPILKLTSPSATEKKMMAHFELAEEDEAEHVHVEEFNEEWPENMSCDIGFTSHLGITNSRMLRSYTLCDPRFREMVVFVKTWSKKRQINSPYLGTLSSYGYVLLVLHFLIQIVQPPVLPNLQRISPKEGVDKSELLSPEGFDIWYFDDKEELERLAREKQVTANRMCLGQLLYEFFEYYAWHWDYSHDVVSIRSRQGILTKEEKNWVAAVQRVGDIQNAYRDRYLFAIEDPFEITHNVARTCNQAGVTNIRNEFKRAVHFLKMCRLEKDGGGNTSPTDAASWEDGLLCEVATPERVRNLSKEKRDKDEFVELLKMIKLGLKVGEREQVTLPKIRRGGSGSWHQNQSSFDENNGRFFRQEHQQHYQSRHPQNQHQHHQHYQQKQQQHYQQQQRQHNLYNQQSDRF